MTGQSVITQALTPSPSSQREYDHPLSDGLEHITTHLKQMKIIFEKHLPGAGEISRIRCH